MDAQTPESRSSRYRDPRGASAGRRTVRFVLQLGFTVLVVWFLADRISLSFAELGEIELSRWRPRWGLFVLSCAMLLSGYLFSGALWGRMVREMGGPRLEAATSVRIFLVANMGRYVPGKVWQMAGLAALAKEKRVPIAVAAAAGVLGQGIAVAAATLIGSATLLTAGPPSYRRTGVWVLGVVGGLLLVGLLPPVTRAATDLWFRVAGVEGPPEVDPGPGFVVRWLLLYLSNWVIYTVSFWVLVRSLGLPGGPTEVAPAFAAAYVLGYVVLLVPAGLGIREGALTVFLAPVVGGSATAAVLSVIARLWTTGVEVLPASAFWLRRLARAGGAGREGGPR